MKKPLFPLRVVVLITTAQEIQAQDEKPSFLLKDYDLVTMLSFFQNKISNEITLVKLEKIFADPNKAIEKATPDDVSKIRTIVNTNEDFDVKIKQLISLYGDLHPYSKNGWIILLAKFLFTKESWFHENEREALVIFPNQVFDRKFFDQRRNDLCLLMRKKI